MTNEIPIGSIADIRMGITLRGRDATRPDPKGSCRMIRIGDISDDGTLTSVELLQFEPGEDIKPDLYLRTGDVLLPNRGTRTTAYVFDLADENVIAGAQFFIIRPKPTRALPAYVAWFLRTETAAQYFQMHRKGTLVQTVQRRVVEDLLMPLPPLPKQHLIVSLDALAIRERQLTAELTRLRSTYFQNRLLNAATNF